MSIATDVAPAKTADELNSDKMRAKLQEYRDNPQVSAKQQGFIDWCADLGTTIDVVTLLASHGIYGTLWRNSDAYRALRAEVAAAAEENKSNKSIETLKSKTPAEKKAALQLALKQQERAAERAEKIKAMMAELDDEDDSDEDESDADESEPEEY